MPYTRERLSQHSRTISLYLRLCVRERIADGRADQTGRGLRAARPRRFELTTPWGCGRGVGASHRAGRRKDEERRSFVPVASSPHPWTYPRTPQSPACSEPCARWAHRAPWSGFVLCCFFCTAILPWHRGPCPAASPCCPASSSSEAMPRSAGGRRQRTALQ